ncbi:MAG: IS630 family transposase [Hyphomicrobiales bacterium]|nr:IS630 family transposase [Hyphomicrobiales bacterium]MBV8240504.1 IS630 family transposase [Hyphomicrobiales bacterium]
MAKPYSQDLRDRVIDAVRTGKMSRRAAARHYAVSESVAVKWLERVERHGSREPVGHGGHRASKLMPHRELLEAARAEKSDVTLQALCDRLSAERGVKADTSMMSRFFRKIGVTFKKTLVAREQDRRDISRHRARWRTYQGLIDPRRLIFLDETWTKTNMTRLRGWAPKGARLIDKVPQGRWKTATFLAALRQDRIDAPCLFDGPINGERFRAYVEQFLVPTLKPGDVVILDNLGSHKGKAVRKAIRDVGARLVFLPKYSPDLNPIEQVFAKFKTLLRKVGARTYEAISDASAEILAQYQPAECAAYLKNAGYA